MTAPASAYRPREPQEPSTPQLFGQALENAISLLKDEVALAKAELKQTARDATKGAGMFGGAGVAALYGGGALVAAAIAGLAVVMPVWLSALIIGAVLLTVAAALAVVGKKKMSQASPAVDRTQANVKRDIKAVKGASS